MTSIVRVLNIFCPNARDTDIRDEIREFLEGFDGCRIAGSGRSCMNPGYFDMEIGFYSAKQGNQITQKLLARFSERCDLDIDWI